MGLSWGVCCLCVATVAFFVLLLGCRSPRPPWWADDFWVANVHAPLLIALGVLGVAELVRVGFREGAHVLAPRQIWPSAVLLAATAIALRALRIRQTLSAHRRSGAAAPVIESPCGRNRCSEGDPDPPARPRGRNRAA